MSDFSKSHISGHDNWSTPKEVLNELDKEYHFSRNSDGTIYDPCPLFGGEEDFDGQDGLLDEWMPCTFINPPYSRGKIAKWVKKAYEESQKGKTVVGLLRGDTSTKWFHDWVLGKAEIIFVKGRIKFGDSVNAPPFPSIIAVWRGS